MQVADAIRNAITAKHVIQFTYNGLTRIAEPHVFGIKNGKLELLIFQIAGQSSSGNLPNWRLVELNKIKDLQIINDTFPGKRPTSTGQHVDFSTIIDIVK